MEFSQALIEILKPLFLPGYLLLEALAIILAFEAIFKSRTSQGAIGWALGLIFISPIVVPAYLMLGERRFHGYVAARRQGDREIQKNAEAVIADMSSRHCPSAELAPKFKLLEALALMPFTEGNSADLYEDVEQAYREMFAGIERAKQYILVQFYIVRDDATGKMLAKRLIKKARQGVRIYFLYDRIGSLGLSRKYLRALRKAGVDVRDFRAFRLNLKGRFQINFRNHRKILLVDGEEAFVGGLNIGDEYRHRHPRLTPWRDTQIRLRGPAVAGVQVAFMEDWYWLSSQQLELNWSFKTSPGAQCALALPTGPADYQDTCQLMFVDAINSARKRVWIVSPYFVPDDAIIKALKLASFRGVEVKILVPGITDNRTAQLASFDFVDELRYTDVQFYQYQNGFLHQKVMLLDDDTAYVGTANLDNRSFRLNFELTVVVIDSNFNTQVEQMLQRDLADSRPLDVKFVQARGLGFRLLVKIARLFAPLQ